MEEKKPSALAELFEKIDGVRLGIKEKAEAQYRRIVEHRNQTQKKQLDSLECDKLKREFEGLLSDVRYADFIKFNNIAEKLLTDELQSAVNRGSVEGLNIAITKISGVLEYIDLITSKDKRMKDFLSRIKK